MARIMAIDYGRKRTGLAVTDPLQLVPGALTTVPTSGLMDYLRGYFEREQVERVVLGHPRQMDGSDSESMRYIAPFIGQFRKAWPHLPLELFDERFTSVLAHRTMLDAGLGRKDRQNKALVDALSATILLQDYMESRKFNPSGL
ncbi:MAG: Holliday junction resolvase RuvX [Paludibacteraceae bacterium]|nr:Holliday junction resolvase RuvX [Paludibacteraceae bacterium]